jgi:hypothetical protein
MAHLVALFQAVVKLAMRVTGKGTRRMVSEQPGSKVNIGILAWIGKGWRRIALYDTRSSWTASADHTRSYGQCYHCIYEPLVHIKVTGVEWGFQVSFHSARKLCKMILYSLAQDKEACVKDLRPDIQTSTY